MSKISFNEIEYEMTSRSDLSRFIYALQDDLRDHPKEWDNRDLGTYLRALAAFLNSAHFYYRNVNENVDADAPSWRLFADCLIAAISYD
jgi:hypothetical protein